MHPFILGAVGSSLGKHKSDEDHPGRQYIYLSENKCALKMGCMGYVLYVLDIYVTLSFTVDEITAHVYK